MTAELPLFSRARGQGDAVAFRTLDGTRSYRELLDASARLATVLLAGTADLGEARVALLAPAGFDYVAAQWATWRAGGVTVPLCLSATETEWEYTLTDSQATVVVADSESASKLAPLCARLGVRLLDLGRIDLRAAPTALPAVTSERAGMILYTSGTTSKPKGVVTTHANIQAQIESLVQAWE